MKPELLYELPNQEKYPELLRDWSCRCHCGEVFDAVRIDVDSGRIKGCGCARGRHKLRPEDRKASRTRVAWYSMHWRCEASSDHYEDYKGRGISVCKRWRSYANFLEDMGECKPGYTLERIDNSKGYEPGNCRWATNAEQQRNKRNNRLETAFGRTQLLIEWSEETGLGGPTIRQRIDRMRWTPEQALATPPHRKPEKNPTTPLRA